MGAARRVDVAEVAAHLLRRSKQRLTASRARIIEVLSKADRPLTIPEILRRRRDLAQSSVYRNLVVLEEAGLVHRIVTRDDHSRYELAEDLTGHHHHLVCARCGVVEDLPPSPGLERSMEAAATHAARATGFRIHQHRLDLVGLCGRCA